MFDTSYSPNLDYLDAFDIASHALQAFCGASDCAFGDSRRAGRDLYDLAIALDKIRALSVSDWEFSDDFKALARNAEESFFRRYDGIWPTADARRAFQALCALLRGQKNSDNLGLVNALQNVCHNIYLRERLNLTGAGVPLRKRPLGIFEQAPACA